MREITVKLQSLEEKNSANCKDDTVMEFVPAYSQIYNLFA